MSVLWNSVRVIRTLIVSTVMALIAALVNKDILEMEQSVKVIILINKTVVHQVLPRKYKVWSLSRRAMNNVSVFHYI